jgi:hypothetical protein
MKKKKHVLSVESKFDFTLIGISSHEKDYFISWGINKKLVINLVKTAGLKFVHPKTKQESVFSMYEYVDKDQEMFYRLISNRSENTYFSEEFNTIDYFLHIRGDLSSKEIEVMMTNLREVKGIITAFIINPRKIKSGKRFIFD